MSKKCIKCSNGAPRFAPTLVASGYSSPKDGICPICGVTYDLTSGKTTSKFEEDQTNKITKIRDWTRDQYWTPEGWEL